MSTEERLRAALENAAQHNHDEGGHIEPSEFRHCDDPYCREATYALSGGSVDEDGAEDSERVP